MEFKNQQKIPSQIQEQTQTVSITESTVCTGLHAQCNATGVTPLISVSDIDFTNPLPFINYNKELDIEIKSSKQLSGKQYLLLIPITKFFKKYRNIYLLINILNGRSIISLRLIEYFVVNYVLENNTYYNLTKYKNKPEFIVDNLFTAGPPTIDITSEVMAPVTTSDLMQQTLKDEIRMAILENKIKQNLVLSTAAVTTEPALTVTVCTGLQAPNVNSTATGVTQIRRPPGVGLELSVSGIKSDTTNTTNNFDDYFLVHDNYKCQLKEYNKKNFDPFCRWTRIRMYYDKTKFFYTTVAQLNFFKWAIENYVLDYILDNLVTIEKAMNDYERAIKKEKKIRKLNMQNSTQTVCTGIESSDQHNATGVTQNSPKSSSMQNNPLISNAVIDIDIDTVCTGLQAECNATDVTQNSRSRYSSSGAMGLEFSVSGTIPDTNTVIAAHLQQQLSSVGTVANSNTGKKITHNLFSTLDKKSKIKGRKKKEFTKTNRSILKYTCTKIVNFD